MMTHPVGNRALTAIGLMSGTSLDGIDAAMLTTDGERVFEHGPAATYPYPEEFRERLRALLGREFESRLARGDRRTDRPAR